MTDIKEAVFFLTTQICFFRFPEPTTIAYRNSSFKGEKNHPKGDTDRRQKSSPLPALIAPSSRERVVRGPTSTPCKT